MLAVWMALGGGRVHAQAEGDAEGEEPPNPFAEGEGSDEGAGDEHNPFAADPPPDPNAGDGTCVPDCQPGYVCYHGQCSSRCNPDCPQGQRCNANATCEPDPTAACPPGAQRDGNGVCVTTVPHAPCQAGMVRTPAGACVPSGNVSCPPGMVISPSGCVPAGAASPPSCAPGLVLGPGGCRAPVPEVDRRPAARARARTRGVLSSMGAALVLGTGITTMIAHRRGDPDGYTRGCDYLRCYPANPGRAAFGFSLLQTASQVLFGVVGSGGGRAARREGATATSAFAIGGWVTWALSTAGQVALLAAHGAAFGNDDVTGVPPAIMYTVTIIGFASLLSFAIDAFLAAGSIPDDAPADDAEQTAWSPRLLVAPEMGGGARGELGVALRF